MSEFLVSPQTPIQSVLTTASSLYYDYLESNNLGMEEIKIEDLKIDEDRALIITKERIINPESLVVFYKDEFYFLDDGENFELIEYKQGLLEFRILNKFFLEELITNLVDSNLEYRIKIYSDLKFLVKNIKTYFENSNNFNLPMNIDSILSLNQAPLFSQSITNEQASAIIGALTSPLSYIWGPPGSGKTQVVIFECLLKYLQTDKKVCILAPTNNALEQIFKSIIKKLDSLDIKREKILRLGTPSVEFMENFYSVCDPRLIKGKNKYKQTDIKERIKQAQIIGLTLDGFIRRDKFLGVDFAHYFLDECAFTPLIKILALSTKNAPITMLGDHKQLMPICEMREKDIKDENIFVSLFNISALYFEQFFNDFNELESNFKNNLNNLLDYKTCTQDKLDSLKLDLAQIKNLNIFKVKQTSPLNHNKTKNFNLTLTHRYGDNLASILDFFIYKNGLKGNESSTEIFVLDCGDSPFIDNTNPKEAQKIAQVYKELKIQNKAIITPFVKQTKQINAAGVPKRHIWTIHRSQGQEFDCVIFSPVMLHYYLTNSQNLNALFALNVAISRIKKQLIIVCDKNYWLKQRGQFLSELIRIAKPYIEQTIFKL